MNREIEGHWIILDFIVWAVADIVAVAIGVVGWIAIWSMLPSGMTP